MKKQPKNTYWTPDKLLDLVKDRKTMTLDRLATKYGKKYQAIQKALKSAENRGIRA